MIRTRSEGSSTLAFITEHKVLNSDVVTVEVKNSTRPWLNGLILVLVLECLL